MVDRVRYAAGVIRDALAGKRIAVTGATGFLGTALVERLLRVGARTASSCCSSAPGRALDRRPAGPARDLQERRFDRLRAELGGSDGLRRDVARRVAGRSPATSAPTASASTTPAAPRSPRCDIVIHSAATVALRLAARRRRRGQPARPDPHRRTRCNELGVAAHLVAVSTCYVAGNRRGAAPEAAGRRRARSAVDVDWRAEVAAARRAARRRRGREPHARHARARSASEARRELGAAGTPLLAAKTEQLRERWVERPHGRGRPGPGRHRSAGPTPTPTPRRSASGR